MITCPDNWVDRSSAGGLILLPRDEEMPGCVVRYVERMIPQRSLWSLVREVLAFDAELVPTRVEPVECFLTEEGEYAALVQVDGLHGELPITHLIGAVFGEDFSTMLDARVRDPARVRAYHDQVRALMSKDRLCLGVRRRRVLFLPPPEWRAVGRGLATALYPPDYPRSLSCIVVSPAEPLGGAEEDVYRQLQRQDEQRGLRQPPGQPVQDEGPLGVTTAQGLGGYRWRSLRVVPGPGVGVGAEVAVARDLVVLRDNTYSYVLRLDAAPHAALEAHREAFFALVDSVRRIYPPSGQPTGGAVSGAAPSPLDSPYQFWDD